MDFTHYYGKHKKKKQSVGQPVVGHTVKKSIRFDDENYKHIIKKVEFINSLDDKMKTDFSKTLNNILHDYFLDERIEQQEFELSDI